MYFPTIQLFLQLLIIVSLLSRGQSNLRKKLRSYATLHHSELRHHIVKRSVISDHPAARKVDFTVFGRSFRLNLHTAKNLFTEDVSISSIDSHAKKHKVDIDLGQFYHGYVTGEEDNSEVHAYFEDKDLVAQIKVRDGTLYVEPSAHHLPKSNKHSMISYWAADVKADRLLHPSKHLGSSYCGYVHPDYDEANFTAAQPSKQQPSRHKRSAPQPTVPVKNTCPLMLVADFKFFRDVGSGSRTKTAAHLIGLIDRIDTIYRDHNFGNYKGVGFEIKSILIHESATPVSGEDVHYNMDRSPWKTKELLLAFSSNDWSKYCLAHLFTAEPFSDGVLGLGWIAKDVAGSPGGICSPNSGGIFYSTAWSSSLNKYGNRILTQEAELVTAHEFGHNWGSQHDPETTECSPSSKEGGKYIMYTYSVSGYESNNEIFSPCTKASVGLVLGAKSPSCFQERNSAFCGNFKVEEDEQCDTGGVEDACCTKQCRFKTGAECSDSNSLCCQNCKFAPSTVLCGGDTSSSLLCEGSSNCSGVDTRCITSNKVDGTECFDNGKCSGGECEPFCESRNEGLKSCICDDIDDSCKFCCQSTDGTCSPYPTNLTLADGKPCAIGTCLAGKCNREITQLTDRLWKIIDNLTVNAVLQWMKSNIVPTVLIISWIIFIPICIVIACIDYRREKEEEEEREWYNKSNDLLVTRADHRPMTRAYLPIRRPSEKYRSSVSDNSLHQRHRESKNSYDTADEPINGHFPSVKYIDVAERM